jgi:hypothetical protein
MSSCPNSTAAPSGRRPQGRVSRMREGSPSRMRRTASRSPSALATVKSYVAPRETSSSDAKVIALPPAAPDSEVDGVDVVDEPEGKTTRGAVDRVDVRVAIEQEAHDCRVSAEHGSMQRCPTQLVGQVDEPGVGVEQRTHAVDVTARGRVMNGMIGWLSDDASALISRALEHTGNLFVAPLAGHLDYAPVVQSVLLGICADVEKEADRVNVSVTCGEMNRRRVPVLRLGETRVAVEQLPQ